MRTTLAPPSVAKYGPCVALFCLLVLAGTTQARNRRPSEAQRLHIGSPEGAVTVGRIDAERTSRSRVPLPEGAATLWSGDVATGFAGFGLVDARGNFTLVAGTERIESFAPSGKRRWTRELDREVATAPVLTNSNVCFVLTRSGRLYGLDAEGRHRLPSDAHLGKLSDAGVSAIPSPLGGAVFALGPRLVQVDDDGRLVADTEVGANVVWLLGAHGTTIAVLEDGAIVEWQPHASRQLTRLERAPGLSPAIDGKQMIVAVGDRLVTVDLDRGTTTSLDSRPNDAFASSPTVVAPGRLAILTESGALLGYDTRGKVVSVEHLGGIQATPPGERYQLVSDATGRFLAATSTGDLTLFDGAGHRASQTLDCAGTPLLLPYAASRVLYVCPSGRLWSIGSPSSTESTPNSPGPSRTEAGRARPNPTGPAGTGPTHP